MIKKIKCFIGLHDTTSYAEQLMSEDFWAKDLHLKLNERHGLDFVESFSESCAIRCKHCSYRFRGQTENDFSMVDAIKARNKGRELK